MIECVIKLDERDEQPLRITLENDRTGTKDVGHYRVRIYQGERLLTRWRIEDFPRGAWPWVLVSFVIDALVIALDRDPSAHQNGFDYLDGGDLPTPVGIETAIRKMRLLSDTDHAIATDEHG